MNKATLKNNARAFRIAGDRCFEEKIVDSGVQFLPVPGIVNYLFAAELYLKYLLLSEGILKKDHDLNNLFDMLGESQKKKLVNLTNDDPEKFKALLKSHANAFVKWRYLHELDAAEVYPNFMSKFLTALENIM